MPMKGLAGKVRHMWQIAYDQEGKHFVLLQISGSQRVRVRDLSSGKDFWTDRNGKRWTVEPHSEQGAAKFDRTEVDLVASNLQS